MPHCPAVDTPGSAWPLCPSLPAAYLFAILFALVLITHIGLAIHYRKPYCLVAIVGCALQTGSFIIRIFSIHNVTSTSLYSDWFILLMIAPVWTNAFAYMILGRMVYNYMPTASVFKIKAWRLGLIFVLLDVVAFLIQVGGLGLVGSNPKSSDATTGIHIYMCGIGFQQLCIFGFLALAIRFHGKLRAQTPSANRSKGLLLLYILYTVVGLISVRIIFRLIEYAHGLNSSISLHQAYEYVFDSTLMVIALALFCIVHPGRIMPGKDANWPNKKQRKAMQKHGEIPHGHLGEDGYKMQHNGEV